MEQKLAIAALAVIIVLALALACAQADDPDYTVTLPIVKTGRVCKVTLFEDGSWSSPGYQIGQPWPPNCTFVLTNQGG